MAGFDIDAAILTLHREAIATGMISGADERLPDPIRTAHGHLHDTDSRRRRNSPCRAAGLCHALYELLQFREEARDAEGVIAAANETELFRKAMLTAGKRYTRTIEDVLLRSQKRHELARTLGRTETREQHKTLCVLPAQAVMEASQLLVTLHKLEMGLRASVWSFELQQSNDKRRGALILGAVYQHLRWGGLTYAEIARLVPDGLGSRGAAERVRWHVREPNARSMMPAELFSSVPRVQVEKGAKRRPSS